MTLYFDNVAASMHKVSKACVWAHWLLVLLHKAVISSALRITNLTTCSNFRFTAEGQFGLQDDGHHSKVSKAAWISNTTVQSGTKCDTDSSQVPLRCDIILPVRLSGIVIRIVKSFEIWEGSVRVWGGEESGSLLRRTVWPRFCNGYQISSSRSIQKTAQEPLTSDTLLSVGGRS